MCMWVISLYIYIASCIIQWYSMWQSPWRKRHLEDQKLSWPCKVHGKMWCCSRQVQVTVEGSWQFRSLIVPTETQGVPTRTIQLQDASRCSKRRGWNCNRMDMTWWHGQWTSAFDCLAMCLGLSRSSHIFLGLAICFRSSRHWHLYGMEQVATVAIKSQGCSPARAAGKSHWWPRGPDRKKTQGILSQMSHQNWSHYPFGCVWK